jgi:hypothetical protein
MENLACSSGFKRFLKSSKTCLKLSSMLAIVSAPCVAVHKSIGWTVISSFDGDDNGVDDHRNLMSQYHGK